MGKLDITGSFLTPPLGLGRTFRWTGVTQTDLRFEAGPTGIATVGSLVATIQGSSGSASFPANAAKFLRVVDAAGDPPAVGAFWVEGADGSPGLLVLTGSFQACSLSSGRTYRWTGVTETDLRFEAGPSGIATTGEHIASIVGPSGSAPMSDDAAPFVRVVNGSGGAPVAGTFWVEGPDGSLVISSISGADVDVSATGDIAIHTSGGDLALESVAHGMSLTAHTGVSISTDTGDVGIGAAAGNVRLEGVGIGLAAPLTEADVQFAAAVLNPQLRQASLADTTGAAGAPGQPMIYSGQQGQTSTHVAGTGGKGANVSIEAPAGGGGVTPGDQGDVSISGHDVSIVSAGNDVAVSPNKAFNVSAGSLVNITAVTDATLAATEAAAVTGGTTAELRGAALTSVSSVAEDVQLTAGAPGKVVKIAGAGGLVIPITLAANVVTPAAGFVTLYLDQATTKLNFRTSDGVDHAVTSAP